jgi:hypothetical protein
MTPFAMAKVIAAKEGCPCEYVESISVTERFKGQIVWQGIVFVFTLDRHPPLETCYGWVDPKEDQLVTVLRRSPVTSPETAVRAYIASRVKT